VAALIGGLGRTINGRRAGVFGVAFARYGGLQVRDTSPFHEREASPFVFDQDLTTIA
jgi:hypothetical protein